MTNKALNTKQKGQIGEDIACRFLFKRGFAIVDRNYRKKWGEIDIIAQTSRNGFSELHFFEVKSVSCRHISHYAGIDRHNPEDNVHRLKTLRMRRTIETYLAEKGLSRKVSDGALSFYVHIVTVRMDFVRRRAQVSLIENVIL